MREAHVTCTTARGTVPRATAELGVPAWVLRFPTGSARSETDATARIAPRPPMRSSVRTWVSMIATRSPPPGEEQGVRARRAAARLGTQPGRRHRGNGEIQESATRARVRDDDRRRRRAGADPRPRPVDCRRLDRRHLLRRLEGWADRE